MSVVTVVERDRLVIDDGAGNVTVTETPQSVSVAASGPQGPPGPQGPAGGARFELDFTAANPVVVNHNLDAYPPVTVVIAGESVDADIEYNSRDQLTVTFTGPQTGTVEVG